MAKASVYFTLGSTASKHDTEAIQGGLTALPGVFSVSVSDSANRVAVDFDTTGTQSVRIQKQLEKMGYPVLSSQTEEHIM